MPTRKARARDHEDRRREQVERPHVGDRDGRARRLSRGPTNGAIRRVEQVGAGAEQRADADRDRDGVDQLRDPEHEGAEQQHADRALDRPQLPFVHGGGGRGVHSGDATGDFCPTRRLPAQSTPFVTGESSATLRVRSTDG